MSETRERFDPAAPERGRAITQIVLGGLALLAVALVVGVSADHGVWTLGRVVPLVVLGFAGALLCGAGMIGLRDARAGSGLGNSFDLAPANVEGESRWARLGRAIEPYDVWLVFAVAVLFLVPWVWSYTLIDPWETHYGEVARRMLADDDWVLTQWQNRGFRSKPVLTFWLIASSLNTFSVATDGGYSGEMITSDVVILAVRLPFVICAAFGIAMIWWMLARLISRRLATFAALVCATTAFYFMVARQAITDMPMVACVMGAIACFAMTLERGEMALSPLAPRARWRWLQSVSSHHVFLGVFTLFVGAQALYYASYFAHLPLARGVSVPAPSLVLAAPMIAVVGLLWVWNLVLSPVRTRGQVWMFWFYTLVGVSVLAKGPPGLGVIGLVCLFYLVLTGRWGLLRRFEIPRGLLITAAIAVPWHVAIAMRAGPVWVNEYINLHILNRFAKGVHQTGPEGGGTFEYFASQLGIGTWPWAALIPAALGTLILGPTLRSPSGRVRLITGIWAITGFAMFCISQTKFHHYILPVIPAVAIAVAFLLDDLWDRRVGRMAAGAIVAVVITLLIARDLIGEHEKLIELYVYRYDRPWPTGEQAVDLTRWFLGFAIVFSTAFALLAIERLRRPAIVGLLAAAIAWTGWASIGYMHAAAPHWGMREVIHTYYAERQIQGIDIVYYGLRELHDDWRDHDSVRVRSVLPDDFVEGAPMTVGLEIPNVGLPKNRVELSGTAVDIGERAFTIKLDRGERETIAQFIDEGASARRRRPPWSQVRADRLIAWQLFWRGENFWTADEIWGRIDDTRTAFTPVDNKAFKKYIQKPEQVGRTFYLITEAARAKGLKRLLPTEHGKETYEIIDTSNNKYTLLRFTL